jgi:DNA-binding transcriptional regulator/RsmH inhibitor MraZ
MHVALVDGQGRLLLPTPVRHYLQALGEDKLFVTSLDRQTARIYPQSVWVQDVQPLMAQLGPCADIAGRIWFVANWLGADCRLNRSGRIVLGQQLRAVLSLDSTQVWIYHERRHFSVLTESAYRRRCQEPDSAGDLLELERAGLN